MKIWITKYALTPTGIIECEGDTRHCEDGDIRARDRDGKFTVTYHEYDWHTTEDRALERVLDMINEEIEVMNERFDVLEKLKISHLDRLNHIYWEGLDDVRMD